MRIAFILDVLEMSHIPRFVRIPESKPSVSHLHQEEATNAEIINSSSSKSADNVSEANGASLQLSSEESHQLEAAQNNSNLDGFISSISLILCSLMCLCLCDQMVS